MRILFIEDDQKIASLVNSGLEEAGYQVTHEVDGKKALDLAEGNAFDLAICDLMLPSIDGYTIIEKLRSKGINFPVLILSAKSSLEDTLKGFNVGCDDYLAKPFSFFELQARVEALIKRSSRNLLSQGIANEVQIENLRLDLKNQRVFRDSKEIILQPKEFTLLRYLVENRGTVVSKKMIIEKVWHYNFDPNTNIVEVRICNLRDKVDGGFEPKLITTVRGAGYLIK